MYDKIRQIKRKFSKWITNYLLEQSKNSEPCFLKKQWAQQHVKLTVNVISSSQQKPADKFNKFSSTPLPLSQEFNPIT